MPQAYFPKGNNITSRTSNLRTGTSLSKYLPTSKESNPLPRRPPPYSVEWQIHARGSAQDGSCDRLTFHPWAQAP
jgi:hypothetical protein